MSLRCHWLWGHVVWFKVWRCGGPKNFSVLRQYYSVLQSTTPVLLCTTQYYASITLYYRVLQSTTLYYKVLRQYYNVLQSTTLYYEVLLQYYSVLPSTTTYYSVLQSTTPVLLCTTKYYNVLPSTTTYYSSTTLNKVTLQTQQILRLPRKMNRILDPHHIWNIVSNALSKASHPPTSPNTAPATKSLNSRSQVKVPEVLPPMERRFDDIRG